MTLTSHDHYNAATALRSRILGGRKNETLVQAWAAVARECAMAESKFRAENPGVHGRRHQAFLSNLDKINWAARAQVETLGRAA